MSSAQAYSLPENARSAGAVDRFRALLFLILLFVIVPPAFSLTVTGETRWSGEVRVEEDLRVAPGGRLIVAAGTRVSFDAALSTKTDPPFWNPDTEISVEGELLVEGSAEAPVRFLPAEGRWGGIVAAPGGRVRLAHAVIERAEEGIVVAGGEVEAKALRLVDCGVGVLLGPEGKWAGEGVAVVKPRIGVVDLTGAGALPAGVRVEGAEDAAKLGRAVLPPPLAPAPKLQHAPEREFLGEYTVEGEERWRGTVVIAGRVTVPPGSMLFIEPGARILFRKVDTDGDGLGEGEILVTGSVRCLGTEEAPVLFDSAEPDAAVGDWDKVSVISSDDPENRFEHAIFRHGVQSLHAHFSSLAVEKCRFELNLRGLQFQESERTTVVGCDFVGNKQALRFRDSEVEVRDSRFVGNLYALHAFRCTLAFEGNLVEGTALGGMLAKESRLVLRDNRFVRNRVAFKARGEGSEIECADNRFLDSLETAISLNETEGLFTGNDFSGAGVDLIGVEGGRLTLRDNRFGPSGRDAIHLNGPAEVDARENVWNADPARRIHDGADDPALGTVRWEPVLEEDPALFLP